MKNPILEILFDEYANCPHGIPSGEAYVCRLCVMNRMTEFHKTVLETMLQAAMPLEVLRATMQLGEGFGAELDEEILKSGDKIRDYLALFNCGEIYEKMLRR